MVLVIVEYSHQTAKLHKFPTRSEADRFCSLLRMTIGVVAAYRTTEAQRYKWPSVLVVD